MNYKLRIAILRSVGSQTRLSASIGIGETRLSRIVNGWVNPTTDERNKIAAALGTSVAELFQASDPDAVAASALEADVKLAETNA